MKTFKQYLTESFSDSAYVFDIDDTILTTGAKILVKDQEGNIKQRLTPAEYNTYIKKPDETLDVSEFRSEDIFRKTAQPTKYFKVIETVSNAIKRGTSNSYIYILTARGKVVKDTIYKYLKDKGIETLGVDQMSTHKFPGLGLDHFDLPITDNFFAESLRLPCNQFLTEEEVFYIINNVKTFYANM